MIYITQFVLPTYIDHFQELLPLPTQFKATTATFK